VRNLGAAISHVSSAMIILSLTMVIAIASSLWSEDVTNLFIHSENIEIESSFIEKNGANQSYYITLILKNKGSMDIKISNVYINEKSFKDFSFNSKVYYCTEGKTLIELNPLIEETFPLISAGRKALIKIKIPLDNVFSGQKIKVEIESITGMKYSTLVIIP
jgi:hypothetical protein